MDKENINIQDNREIIKTKKDYGDRYKGRYKEREQEYHKKRYQENKDKYRENAKNRRDRVKIALKLLETNSNIKLSDIKN
jgi:hypothetical protein